MNIVCHQIVDIPDNLVKPRATQEPRSLRCLERALFAECREGTGDRKTKVTNRSGKGGFASKCIEDGSEPMQ